MTYKGIEIDGYIYKTTADIDKALEERAVAAYITAFDVFASHRGYVYACHVDECAERLVNEFGYTWERVEEIA